ncbi:hypothetical protein [Spongiimicrobium salis]|uniref:hypothetical protein n=1 Tax=Spongiimicrobium salis TaxID=1667022 RepID=UPI00374C9812
MIYTIERPESPVAAIWGLTPGSTFYISRKDNLPLALAAIYTEWKTTTPMV